MLEMGLKAVAEDEATLGASNEIEQRLLAEVRAIGVARRRRARAVALAIAAVLTIAVAIPAWRVASTRRAAERIADTTRDAAAPDTTFFPLGYSDVPVSGAQLVRIEVPRSTLRSFGVAPIDPPGAAPGATVLADVLVGADGLARAVRFVSVSRIKEKR
jgi:hypothetical protein